MWSWHYRGSRERALGTIIPDPRPPTMAPHITNTLLSVYKRNMQVICHGVVAQMVERPLSMREVGGSIPSDSMVTHTPRRLGCGAGAFGPHAHGVMTGRFDRVHVCLGLGRGGGWRGWGVGVCVWRGGTYRGCLHPTWSPWSAGPLPASTKACLSTSHTSLV